MSSIALSTDHDLLSREIPDGKTSSRQVVQLIKELLAEGELRPGDLDCIAFGCGPGSFTGVRVATSVAQGIAYAQSLPVCRISTLAALAAAAVNSSDPLAVVSCLDARMGEAYLGVYTAGEDGIVQQQADQLIDPAEYRLPALPGTVVAAGHGWEVYPELLERNREAVGQLECAVWPTAASVLGLARREFFSGNTVSAVKALPNYVRDRVTN
jgi:tRNA threonylcarbamoyladenosine biosynthesis protein TsaB